MNDMKYPSKFFGSGGIEVVSFFCGSCCEHFVGSCPQQDQVENILYLCNETLDFVGGSMLSDEEVMDVEGRFFKMEVDIASLSINEDHEDPNGDIHGEVFFGGYQGKM
ncbi:hypothetical protein SUGI_0755740 [Cryptomeria japonica]|nr:hypothetical protein SUGI_0755740 [Cryptomeria japonica]